MKTQWILQLLIYMINTGSNVLKTRFNEVRPMCCFFSTKVKFNRIRDAFLDSKMDLENSLKIAKHFNFHWVFTGLVNLLRAWFWWCIITKGKTSKPLNLWKLNEKQLFKRISKEFPRPILEPSKASLIRLNFTIAEKKQHIWSTQFKLVFCAFVPLLNM